MKEKVFQDRFRNYSTSTGGEVSQQEFYSGIPPHDNASERAVLGAMLVDSRAVEIAITGLRVIDFFIQENRTLFTLFKEMAAKNPELDAIEIDRECTKRRIKHSSSIAQLIEETPTAANIERYVAMVKAAKLQRDLWELANQIRHQIDNGESATLEFTERQLNKIRAEHQNVDTEPIKISTLAKVIAKDAIELPEIQHIGLKCNFADNSFEHCIYFEPNQQTIIGARTSMGKTTFCMGLALNIVECNPDAGELLYITTEAGQESIARAMLATMAGLHIKGIAKRNLTTEQKARLKDAANNPALRRIRIAFIPGATLMQVRAIAKRHKANYGLPMMFVDLAGKLSAAGDKEYDRMTAISNGLFQIKGDLNTHLVATVQVGRGSMMNEGKRPTLGDLKASGAWEEDADKVLLLHRPGYYGGNARYTEIHQAKDRAYGDCRTLKVEYKPAYGTFCAHHDDVKEESPAKTMFE